MSTDYRYQRQQQPDLSNVSTDTRAIVMAIQKGWIGRGFAIGFGISLFGFIAWLLWFFIISVAFRGVHP